MTFIGKIVGAILGFMVGGPFGLVMGIILGHLYDSGYFQYLRSMRPTARAEAEKAFFNTTFLVMGHLAKIDGRITTNEIAFARHVMAQLQLSAAAEQSAIELFGQGKQPDFNLISTLQQFKHACQNDRSLLRVFIEIQIQLAMADHQITSQEKMALLTICETLGFSPREFVLFSHTGSDHTQNRSRTYKQAPDVLTTAYETLNVMPNVNDAELKRSYRRLMSQHHPDKLAAKGLPSSMIKIATEKTQEIKAAYELVCKSRGIK